MRRIHAYTLLELMVVVAVASALAFVAMSGWPAYRDRSRRAAAGAALVATLAQLELRHARTGTYQSPDDSPGPTLQVDGYRIDVHADCTGIDSVRRPRQCIEIQAVPSPPTHSDACGTLVLRSTGERLPPDPACWP
ncbi:prepilin-type N-terminal cleavage/methylation domain-containing protein [Ralstonia sp. R-29]|uniref:prepilin-type N-terminal cleavage/methylation domain-containing protein n=1 Tax=Ralstonia sp. R-29 TaxID=3404059 RepID=UPI003CEFAB15